MILKIIIKNHQANQWLTASVSYQKLLMLFEDKYTSGSKSKLKSRNVDKLTKRDNLSWFYRSIEENDIYPIIFKIAINILFHI